MRTLFLTILLTHVVISGVKSQNTVRWNSWDTVDEKVKKANRKFLVYFYFDGCKWCRYLEETTLKNDATSKFINNNFYAFKVNALTSDKIVVQDHAFTSVHIGKYDFHELAADLLSGKMSFPAIVFLDENFTKIAVEEGYTDTENFEMVLSYYAGNHFKKTIWKRFANNYCRENHFNSLVNSKN